MRSLVSMRSAQSKNGEKDGGEEGKATKKGSGATERGRQTTSAPMGRLLW